jgi:hypothetical protein
MVGVRSTRSSLAAAVVAVALAAVIHGCGSAAGEKAGTQCFSTVDCALGLVCIPTSKAAGAERVCSSNISSIETKEDAGMDAQPPADSAIPDAIFPVDTGVEDAPAKHSAS